MGNSILIILTFLNRFVKIESYYLTLKKFQGVYLSAYDIQPPWL